MANKNKFENYLSDFISTDELSKLLSFFKKQKPGHPFLIFSVNDSGDGMVSGVASTWMQISSSREDMLCYMLQDDDGKSELETFPMSISGLADCLDALSSQQDQVDYESFYKEVKKLIL